MQLKEFKKRSHLELCLELDLVKHGIPKPEQEYRFDDKRRWRFDFAWPSLMVACEVEGGVWSNGRHTRGSGFIGDLEKYNAAMLRGWSVYRCTREMIMSGEAVKTIKILIGMRQDEKARVVQRRQDGSEILE